MQNTVAEMDAPEASLLGGGGGLSRNQRLPFLHLTCLCLSPLIPPISSESQSEEVRWRLLLGSKHFYYPFTFRVTSRQLLTFHRLDSLSLKWVNSVLLPRVVLNIK